MKRILIILFLISTTSVFAADQWSKSSPAGSDLINNLDSLIGVNNSALDRLLSNYRSGMLVQYLSASTITVTAGEIVCSNASASVRRFRKTSSDTTVTWSDIDTGAEAASTTYYIYAVADTDVTDVTYKISLSASAPSSATYYARLGSFYNDASSNIINVYQSGKSYKSEFGTPTAGQIFGTAYQATSDGFIVVRYQGSVAGASAYIYIDSDNPPTTEVYEYSDPEGYGRFTEIYPVKTGNYYKVSATNCSGSIAFWPLQ